MLLALVLVFTLLPMVEIYLLFQLGGVIGWSLARQQGLATLARLSRELADGRAPADALSDGALILLAGALLVTPGVLTDTTGFLLLVPAVRRFVKPLLGAALRRSLRGRGGVVRVWSNVPPTGPRDPRVVEGRIVEVRTSDADEAP